MIQEHDEVSEFSPPTKRKITSNTSSVSAAIDAEKPTIQLDETNEIFDHVFNCISTDVKKLYLERPCKDQNSVLRYNVSDWLKERPVEIVNHLRELGNLNHSPRSDYLSS